ncbi:hypothetical protein CLOM_g11287 [Closterium sp. NIES-68]|nr:hypothetical protein CLOM_g11287 [Closterium sp. NIES-68]GJP77959.1 hypothetical protein CLOP_g8279 [Closterium sp. NIES-67]
MPPALNRSSSAAAAAAPANAKMYSAQGPHVVGLEEIEALKASANNLFVEGKFGQAIIGYSYAIKQMAGLIVPSARRASTNLDSPSAVASAVRDAKPDPRTAQLAAILYSNRAAAYLKLEKYDKAALDAGAASVIDGSNFKAWLRKAMAHKEVGQWYECHMACKAATRLEPGNEDARSLFEESQYKMGSVPHAPAPQPQPVLESQPSKKKFGLFGRR